MALEDLDGRRLPRAVRSKKCEDLAAEDLEINAADRLESVIGHAQTGDFDDDVRRIGLPCAERSRRRWRATRGAHLSRQPTSPSSPGGTCQRDLTPAEAPREGGECGAADGIGRARVMIAPDPDLASIPVSHPEQACGPRRLPVLVASSGFVLGGRTSMPTGSARLSRSPRLGGLARGAARYASRHESKSL